MNTNKGHHGLFYGWWIVVSGFIISFLTGGTVFFGFTAILEPLAEEFGWSYTQISLAASLRGLEMGLLAPIIGLVVDRWGPRVLISGGAVCIGLGLVLLSRINSLGLFYVSFVLIAMGMSTLSGTVLLTAVANWFRKKMAITTGIVVSGTAAGGILVPIVSLLIDKYEWRTAMIILGLCVVCVILPLSLLFRHRPESYGYLPDGDVSVDVPAEKKMAATLTAEDEIPEENRVAARVFWHMALASLCHMVVTSAVVTHVMPYLTSTGITRAAASLVAGVLPLASIGGRLGSGWFGDRFIKRGIAAIGFALVAIGMLFFGSLSAGGLWLLLPFIVFFSTGWGCSVTMRAALLREYYSRSRFGKMYGFLAGVAMLGTVAGAPLAGWVYDRWNTYQGIWFVFAGFAVAAMLMMLTIPPIQRRAS